MMNRLGYMKYKLYLGSSRNRYCIKIGNCLFGKLNQKHKLNMLFRSNM